MKLIIITVLLLPSLLGAAQFRFEANSDTTIFDTPHDTLALFQYKFLEASPWHFSTYLELTYHQDSSWSYKRVIISNIDNKQIELPQIDPPFNINILWQELDNVGFLSLKPENEEIYRVTVDGNFIELPYEKYQMMSPTDHSNYVSEFYSELGIRTIMHYAPISIMNKLNKAKQTYYVPELYKAVYCYELIKGKFQFADYRKTFYEYFNSVKQENTKKKRNLPNRSREKQKMN